MTEPTTLDRVFPPEHCELEREKAIESRIHATLRGVELVEQSYDQTPMNPYWCPACNEWPVPHTCAPLPNF